MAGGAVTHCCPCFAIAKPPVRTKHHIIMTIEIPKTNPPAANSFVNLPVVTDWQDLQAEAVIFGVPHGKPYLADQFPNDQSTAPAALRKADSA